MKVKSFLFIYKKLNKINEKLYNRFKKQNS